MEALPIQKSFKYTGHVSGPNLGLKKICIHLYLVVLVMASSGYTFFNNIVLSKSSSLANLDSEHHQCSMDQSFIRLILCPRWQK